MITQILLSSQFPPAVLPVDTFLAQGVVLTPVPVHVQLMGQMEYYATVICYATLKATAAMIYNNSIASVSSRLNTIHTYFVPFQLYGCTFIIIANNCADAGKLNCVINTASDPPELCNVTTPQGQCYCDMNCMPAPGSSGDCCSDAIQMPQNGM